MRNYKNKKPSRSKHPTKVDSCTQLISREEKEAIRRIEYLTTPCIDLRPEDRSKQFSSHFLPPAVPAALSTLSPQEVMQIINTQFPKKWRKQITEVVW